ncbi:MAG: cold-shock protein [Candidatus Marinimicrobia bacterium]|nr:cold-shock protein [Candidatus Neomarinimicrobiota bacterium]
MQEGTVKFFNQNKNYGFIAGDDSKDYFVHSSGIAEGIYLKEGDKVSFEVVDGEKGPKAEKVEIID